MESFMIQCGEFTIRQPGKPKIILPNTLVGEGALLTLQNIFQAAATWPTNFYLGLTTADYSYATVLTDVEVAEPSGHGYARQAIVRSGAGWDTSLVNQAYRALSAVKTFTASSDWDKPWQNAFIATVASGAGKLLAISSKYPTPLTVVSGAAPSVDYQFWLRGL